MQKVYNADTAEPLQNIMDVCDAGVCQKHVWHLQKHKLHTAIFQSTIAY